MTTNRRIIQTLRHMEWERAKGSLNAILASFWEWNVTHFEDEISFDELVEMVKKFIKDFGEATALD